MANLHVQEVVVIIPLHGAHSDALIIFEQASNRVIQTAVQTPLAIKRVGLTPSTWKQSKYNKTDYTTEHLFQCDL